MHLLFVILFFVFYIYHLLHVSSREERVWEKSKYIRTRRMRKRARMNKHGEKEESNRGYGSQRFLRDRERKRFTSVYTKWEEQGDLCFSNFVLSPFFYYYYYCNFVICSYYVFFFLFSFSSLWNLISVVCFQDVEPKRGRVGPRHPVSSTECST